MPSMDISPVTPDDDLRTLFQRVQGRDMIRATNQVLRWGGKQMQKYAREKRMLPRGDPLGTDPDKVTRRSGSLSRSVYYRLGQSNKEIQTLWFGAGEYGRTEDYAAVHEQDGRKGSSIIIHAKPGGWLKIPFDRRAVTSSGTPSKAGWLKNLTFVSDPKRDNIAYLIQPRARSDVSEISDTIRGRIIYILVKHVRIPSRPYLRPAIDHIRPEMEKRLQKALGIVMAGGTPDKGY